MLFRLVIALFCLKFISGEEKPIVEISNGELLGLAHENYYSFEGIPYAEAPIGMNRFESPKPYVDKWTDIRDATKLRETCIQNIDRISLTKDINGSEDCLFVNIYTPDINNNKNTLYPVIFYIHGGGFMYGTGDVLREKILMKQQNVILVTFNYRLNLFGFLSTLDTTITGNMGLKDQLLALKWTKENILAFNGNPDEILIAGYSAGSASVEYLTLTEGIDDLAKAAFGMSGSVLNDWAFNPDPRPTAIKLGQLLDCPVDNSVELKTCLKAKSANEIVSTVNEFRNFMGSSIGVFAPVVEHKSVTDAIITDTPKELLKMGKFSKIPFLASYTAEDGALFTSSIYNDLPTIIKSNNVHFLSNEPWLYDKKDHTEHCEKIFKDITKGNLDSLTKLLTDRVFKDGILESLDLRRQIPDSKTYSYVYDNPAPFGLGNLIAKDNTVNFGTNHGDDVFLMFNFPPRDEHKFRPDEEKISDNFVTMMKTFVTTGVPIFGDIEIPKITLDKFEYLHIKADDYKIEPFVIDAHEHDHHEHHEHHEHTHN